MMVSASVNFEIKPDRIADFRKAMLVQARNSLDKESGCRQFDVCFDPKDDKNVFLYEVYDDKAAWDAHLASDHFKSFFATVSDWLASKEIRTWERVDLK